MSEVNQSPKLDLYSLSEGLRHFLLPNDERIEHFDPEILPAIHRDGRPLILEPVSAINKTLLTGFFAQQNLSVELAERDGKSFRLTYGQKDTDETEPVFITEITQLFGEVFHASIKECRRHRATDKISILQETQLDSTQLDLTLRTLYTGSVLVRGDDLISYYMMLGSEMPAPTGAEIHMTPTLREIGRELQHRADQSSATDFRRLPDIVATLNINGQDPIQNEILELNVSTEPVVIIDNDLLDQFAVYKLDIPALRQKARDEHQLYCDTHVVYDAQTGDLIAPGTIKVQ